MQTAKLFQNGSGQDVRLPNDKAFEMFMESIGGFTDDYFAAVVEGRKELFPERVEGLQLEDWYQTD